MSSTVKIEQPFEFVLRAVKTKGLRDNTFDGRRVTGKQISVQLESDDIERIQKVWDVLKAKKSSPFFEFNGANNMLTIKARKVSESLKKSCVSKDGDNIYVDVKFEMAEIYVDKKGSRYPQVRMLGLKKVDSLIEEFVVTEHF